MRSGSKTLASSAHVIDLGMSRLLLNLRALETIAGRDSNCSGGCDHREYQILNVSRTCHRDSQGCGSCGEQCQHGDPSTSSKTVNQKACHSNQCKIVEKDLDRTAEFADHKWHCCCDNNCRRSQKRSIKAAVNYCKNGDCEHCGKGGVYADQTIKLARRNGGCKLDRQLAPDNADCRYVV